MTTSRVDLKAYFRDGEVPTGHHFSTLIDSMVHVDEFRSWRRTGEIDLGDGKWRVYVDANDRFVIDPDTPSRSRPALALWHEGGWVGMQGRVGTYDPVRDAACGDAPSPLQVPLNVRADGKWQPVLSNLEGCHAFELVARVAGPPASPHAGISRAVALASPAGADVTVQQAPAHRTLRRNLVSLVLLVLFVTLILGLPEKYIEKGRAGSKAVKAATEQVEQSRKRLESLDEDLSNDVVDIYAAPNFGNKDERVTLTWRDGRRELEKVGSIKNNFVKSLKTTIYSEDDGKEIATVIPGDSANVSIKGTIKGAQATLTDSAQKALTDAQHKLSVAEKKLEELENTHMLPRLAERLATYGKPAGILGIVIIAFNLLRSHLRHRAAIRVKWRKHTNKLIGGDAKYDLCLRTGRNYGVDAAGAPVKIHYHITKLWA